MTEPRALWGDAFRGADGMQAYQDTLVAAMFEPWAEWLVDRLGVRPGDELLDVACGPGTVARVAARRIGAGGRVTACDLSAAMLALALAKPHVPGWAPVDYRECAADGLDVPDGGHDVLVCQQGFQFFPDRPAALAEMRRALRPGGRLGIAVWAALDRMPPFAALEGGIRAVLGDEVADRYRGGPWGLSDPGELAALVAAAGFAEVDVVEHSLDTTFRDGADQLLGSLAASGVAADVAALSDPDRQALAVEVRDRLAPWTAAGGAVRAPTTSNVVTARR